MAVAGGRIYSGVPGSARWPFADRGGRAARLGTCHRATRLRSDNGSEFNCEALAGWLPQVGTKAIPVAPASPWENGFIESFHSRLRDEFLECEEFESVHDARAKADGWRREYNRIRPHSALGYQTPRMYSDACDRGRHGQPPKSADDNASTYVNGTLISGGPKNG